MFVARVTGSVVATQKLASMTGCKLLTVEPYRVDEKERDRLVPTGRTFGWMVSVKWPKWLVAICSSKPSTVRL